MMQPVTEKGDIGVIVGRFQVHKLHTSHVDLINTVLQKHKKVVIVLGVSQTLGGKNNPLDFLSRKQMILESYPESHFPNLTIISLRDNRSDEIWSKNLDERVRDVCPLGSIVLYGGRDSFISYYSGQFKTVELEPESVENFSGTALRKDVSLEVIPSSDFRAGVIYSCYNRFSSGLPVVDIAVVTKDGHLVLGKKPGENKFRFPGGFFDPKYDSCFEDTVKREMQEELRNCPECDNIDYIGSLKIDDWRFRPESDKIISSFYQVTMGHGKAKAGDDLESVFYIPLNKIERHMIMEEHIPLMEMFLKKNNLNWCN